MMLFHFSGWPEYIALFFLPPELLNYISFFLKTKFCKSFKIIFSVLYLGTYEFRKSTFFFFSNFFLDIQSEIRPNAG